MTEQNKKHDGYLDDRNEGLVQYGEAHAGQGLYVKCINIYDNDDIIELNATQALSLLAWLQREHEELQRMAKKQTGGIEL